MQIARPVRRKNSIVITSLVDVMFVLLFFFMLASSYLDWGAVDVNIGGAESKATVPVPVPGHVHQLQLLPGAQLNLDGNRVTLSDLASRLERDARVIVQPQAGVPLQEMVSVIDQLKAAGVSMTLGRASP